MVTMRRHYYLLLATLAVLLSISAAAAAPRGPATGGWEPIENINDPHVKEIAEFAVSEYNKKSNKKLAFQSVVKGETQVVAGQNYRLVIAVKGDNSLAVKYEAVVWERVWLHSKILTSFKQVNM
ncbi:hypothetical protein M0R45_028413 [Rubus argutus]|uniref:Cystatin domain-containing protein n=1 Tax=Rubus argutus TaxID=59490 RepID=A0AAW1W5L6_RUBAR